VVSINTWVKYEEKEDSAGIFKIQPLKKGMGLTLGNALRRILLSRLSGSAVVGIKIKGVTHEFSTIPNIVEDVLEIICNVKSLIIKNDNDSDTIISLKSKGKKVITAKDLNCPQGVEVINKNQHLFQMLDKADIDLEIFVINGEGYLGVKDTVALNDSSDIELISLDASFSPVSKVNYEVTSIRVGKALDNDLLTLTVQTNGTTSPETSVIEAVKILKDELIIFDSINVQPEQEDMDVSQADEKLKSILNMSIDDLELSARSSNCLRRAGIERISELLQKDMSELFQIKNFGKKSADEINGKLNQFDLALREA